MKTLQRRRSAAKRRFKFSTGAVPWSGVTLEVAATSVGLKDEYDTVYRVTSQYDHSSMWATRRYQSSASYLAEIRPSAREVDRTLSVAVALMAMVNQAVISALGLGLKRKARDFWTLPQRAYGTGQTVLAKVKS